MRDKTRREPALFLVAAAWLAWGAPGRVDAEAPKEQGATDWPSMISRLKQQAYENPGHARTRQQLAIAYNNYGVSLSDQGQLELATEQLQEALRLDGDNAQLRHNLANIYLRLAQQSYQRHEIDAALSALDQAAALNPDLVQAFILRGEIEYDRQKLKEAQASWRRALELDPAQTQLAQRLEHVTQELPVESKFERLSQAFFDLRYEEQLERPVGFDIRDALLEARRSVGSDFACWPKHRIVVLIYSAAQFHALRAERPDWVGGEFDGKIRVPLPGGSYNQAMVKNIIFHEYTHAVVHELTNGTCPLWLNEGLAEYEGRTQLSTPLRALANAHEAKQVIPWSSLSDRFSTTLSHEEVSLAYEESYSIAAYLVTRYGFVRVRRLLKALAARQPWEAALADEFRMKLSRLEERWREWLPEILPRAP